MASENEIQVLSAKKHRPKKWIYALWVVPVLIGVSLLFWSRPKMKLEPTNIDSTLQTKVSSLLEEKLKEIWAYSGQAIVMETKTGAIKAMVGLQRNFDDTYIPCDLFAHQQATGLMHTISYMVALETGKIKLTDTVDTQYGIYIIDDSAIKDHNWHRGGYGVIDYEKGFITQSNIATCKAVQKAFKNRPQPYFDALDSLKWGKVDHIKGIPNLHPRRNLSPKDSLWASYNYPFAIIGYNQKIAPIQTLASYNAIANNGIMVKPQIYKGEPEIIDDSIASSETIKAIQQAMRNTVAVGLGKPAHSDKVNVAGKTAHIAVSDEEDDSEGRIYTNYLVEFCGYFPADNPKYSIIVSINKRGLPVSGGLMAGSVFSEIVDFMIERE